MKRRRSPGVIAQAWPLRRIVRTIEPGCFELECGHVKRPLMAWEYQKRCRCKECAEQAKDTTPSA